MRSALETSFRHDVPYLPAYCDTCRLACAVSAMDERRRCDTCRTAVRITAQQTLDDAQLGAFVELAGAVRLLQLDAEQCQMLLFALAVTDDTEEAQRTELKALSRLLPSLTLARVAVQGDGREVTSLLRVATQVLRARMSAPRAT